MRKTTDYGLVGIWSDFVNWKQRKAGEAGFIESQLRKNKCRAVYDLCLGGGFDSIELILAGFDVTSNEIDLGFVKLAKQSANERKVELKLTSYDWRELPPNPKFGAALMLGNSLIYINDHKYQEKIMKNVFSLLNREGTFIIDHRNFEYILNNKEEILKDPKNNFKYSRKYVYCGNDVIAYPVEINDENVLFEYLEIKTGKKYHIEHHPIREKEMRELLRNAGFSRIETFYDYKQRPEAHYDFIQHLARK